MAFTQSVASVTVRVQITTDEHASLLLEADNLVDALSEMVGSEDLDEDDRERRRELHLALHIQKVLLGPAPWFIEAERRQLETWLVTLRETQRLSLHLGAGTLNRSDDLELRIDDQVVVSIDLPHSKLHPDAIARHRSYEDQCLDTMRVCDVLIKRLADS